MYTLFHKNVAPNLCQYLYQILTIFKIRPMSVATLPCDMSSRNRHARPSTLTSTR